MTTKNTTKIKKTLISLVGPTAVGKTSMAIKLAKEFNAEIISADSRQFYKELTIGTAKPTIAEQTEAKHHFIDNKSINEDYNASQFENEVIGFLNSYFENKDIVILCGGSGMYIDAVLKGFDDEIPTKNLKIRNELIIKLEKEGIVSLQKMLQSLDPIYYNKVDLKNSKRILRAIEVCLITGKPYSSVRKGKKRKRNFEIIKVGIELNRQLLYERINNRVDQMMSKGLINEVKSVQSFEKKNALKTVGYRELFSYLKNEYDLNYAVEKIKINTRRYAKRQLTWFKKDLEIQWYQADEKAEISQYIRNRFISL